MALIQSITIILGILLYTIQTLVVMCYKKLITVEFMQYSSKYLIVIVYNLLNYIFLLLS